jgi:hypothetical protein
VRLGGRHEAVQTCATGHGRSLTQEPKYAPLAYYIQAPVHGMAWPGGPSSFSWSSRALGHGKSLAWGSMQVRSACWGNLAVALPGLEAQVLSHLPLRVIGHGTAWPRSPSAVPLLVACIRPRHGLARGAQLRSSYPLHKLRRLARALGSCWPCWPTRLAL